MNVYNIVPKVLADELLRLTKIDRNWLQIDWLLNNSYRVMPKPSVEPTWINNKICGTGADYFGMWSMSDWLADGPKIFRPTAQQCEAMEQVEIRLELNEYSQPYPALLIELPAGRYGPFVSVIAHHRNKRVLTFQLLSVDHVDDVVTTIAVDGRPIEISLQTYDNDLTELAQTASKALRVAANSCLALSSYGCHADYLLKKAVESDRSLAQEHSERGQRARARLKLAIKVVSFDREIVLHRTETRNGTGQHTDREMSFHWRRGHWHTVLCGKGKTERKRVLYPPTMIRADLLTVDTAETTTSYVG